MVTQNIEDYMKVIYKLQSGGRKVTTSELAGELGLRDGSVTEMLKKLAERKLIEYAPYRGVRLTEAGLQLALKTVRRHRLWEMFLVRFLAYSWDEVHDEAELLEHVTSNELERRLDKALGHPKADPHGAPIPDAKGNLSAKRYLRLADAGAEKEYAIIRVEDESSEALQYLERIGLGLNQRIRLVEKIRFDGSVIIKVRGREIPLSSHLAQNIFVEPI